MKHLLTLFLVFFVATTNAEQLLGIHLASAHFPAQLGQNNDNFGLYLRKDNWQVGAYRNTFDRSTIYVSYNHKLAVFDVLFGAATGYKKLCEDVAYLMSGKRYVRNDVSAYLESRLRFEEECVGFSKHSVTPVFALSWQAPEVLGVFPRFTVVPGTKKSSSVLHLSLEMKI